MHKFVALSMASAPQQQGIVPIKPAHAMHRILKNPETKIWGILSCFAFRTGATAEDHLNLLTKPSTTEINILGSLSTVKYL
jgi:hypothetical protein